VAASAPGPDRKATPSDEELVSRVLSGDRDRFGALVERYQARLYRHAFAMVMDDDTAADLVQDAFVKAYGNLSGFHGRASFGTWVFQILRNRCLDHLKEKRRSDQPLEAYHDVAGEDDGTVPSLERLSMRRDLDRAMAAIPENLREAFTLKYVEELSYEEMAEILGASESALRMRVLRAREALRAVLPARTEAGPAGM